jgi:cell division protein FtsI/penicillin-binding protein 2
MFHRRLLLLASLVACIMALLGAQLMRLSVVEASDRRAAAEARLDIRTYLPTRRGEIRDRRNRTLAQDRASDDLALRYSVITGSWATERAWTQAKRETPGWAALGPEERMRIVERLRPLHEDRIARVLAVLRSATGLSAAELQRRFDLIKQDVHQMAAHVWEEQRLAEQIRFGGDEAAQAFSPRPIREQLQAHVILPRVPAEVAFELRKLELDHPDLVEVQDSQRREYPWQEAEVLLDRTRLPRPARSAEPLRIRVSGVADHILGQVRDQVFREDLERRPFRDPVTKVIDLGGYRAEGDAVGARGIELVFEDHLRGRRGMIVERLDTGSTARTEHAPGRDVQLTLDIQLQARVQAILSPEFGLTGVQQWHAGWHDDGTPRTTGLPLGTPLNSAAVVIEVETGHILAMVSMPTLAMGQALSTGLSDQELARLAPSINRPVEAIYPPGSIIKPLVLSAAIMERVYGLDGTITCTGHFFPEHTDRARCWLYRPPAFSTHGEVGVEEAIARSCNIFFYTLADRLGMKRLSEWYRRFGLGEPLDVGLLHSAGDAAGRPIRLGESGGRVPDDGDMAALRARGELHFASIIMGIGQGPVAWTPVQAANAYATLARAGRVLDATLIVDDTVRPGGPRTARPDLRLDPAVVARALEGLRRSVMEDYGTGHHIRYADRSTEPIINAPGVTVWAKTGTAQAPPIRSAPGADDGDGDSAMLDHAWFVGLVGPGARARAEPQYAIAVIVEYGGSGGRTAGPVANQIILALQDEGYLPAPGPGEAGNNGP